MRAFLNSTFFATLKHHKCEKGINLKNFGVNDLFKTTTINIPSSDHILKVHVFCKTVQMKVMLLRDSGIENVLLLSLKFLLVSI